MCCLSKGAHSNFVSDQGGSILNLSVLNVPPYPMVRVCSKPSDHVFSDY